MEKKQRTFIMSPPVYYEINYLINEWTKTSREESNDVMMTSAVLQWLNIFKYYLQNNIHVELIEPKPEYSELTFPGDSIFLFEESAIISNFKYSERQKEAQYLESWAREKGFNIHKLPRECTFEGNAETILWNKTLLMGYGTRNSYDSAKIINSILGIEVIPLKLKSPFFHLDISIFPITDDCIALCREAFSDKSYKIIKDICADVIEVPVEEAKKLACNTIVYNNTALLNFHYPFLEDIFSRMGYSHITFNLSESAKVGGGIKCHTLEHYFAPEAFYETNTE